MARVLVVSKFRQFQGGVERHIYDLIRGLSERNHDVEFFTSEDVTAAGGARFSATAKGFERVKSAGVLMWNPRARIEMDRVVHEFQPDIIHYHSIYHQLSPSVIGMGEIPTVMTLHDYKLAAPCYSLYRDRDVCDKCVGMTFATPAIKYKCVSGSTAASALCAAEGLIHRRRHQSQIDQFIVPSRFAYNIATRAGLPPDRVSIVRWGVSALDKSEHYRSNTAFFAGRLHPTKGLDVLLDAWQSLPTEHGCELRIAGEGELEPMVRSVAAQNDSVKLLGMLTSDAVMDEVRAAGVAIMPSLVPETMGLSAVEALVTGTPLICSSRGALAEFAGPGVWTLPRVDAASMRKALVGLLAEGRINEYRSDLRNRDLSEFSFDRMIDAIEAVYERALGRYATR